MKLKQFVQLTTFTILFLTLGLLCANSSILASETDNIDRCKAVSLESAAGILNVTIDELHKSSSDLMVSPDDLERKIYKTPPYTCSISSKTNFLKIITYVTYDYNDPGQARLEFDKMRNGFETVSKVDMVPDIGDAAFWAGDNRFQRMVSIKGGVVIDILSPKDFEIQKQLIRQVLDTL